LATHGDGFCTLTGFGAETFNEFDFNVLLGEAFNVLHEAFFVQTHQIDGSTVGTCTASTANAVHIVFAHIGDFVVYDVG
jgi:hypothetical protein